MMVQPRSVVFDIGNVLIRWDPRLVYAGSGLSDAELDAFFEAIDFPAWNLAQDRGRSWAEGVAVARAAAPRYAPLIEKFARDWQLAVPGVIEGTVAILSRLSATGVPLYAITNFSAEKWAETLERFPFIGDSFRDIVVSAHEGLVKPDPAIFKRFLTRSGQVATECIFIDDSPANVATARTLGMDAIRFAGPARLARDLRGRGLAV